MLHRLSNRTTPHRYQSHRLIYRMVVERMVVVVVGGGLGHMVELGLGRSSCSDASRLVVVVELVGMGLLVVLVVLEDQLVLGYRVLLGVLVVHLVLALLDLRVVPLVLGHLVVLELVVVVGVGGGVGMAVLVLREWKPLLEATLGNCNHMVPAIAY